jgi:hypothetical protein
MINIKEIREKIKIAEDCVGDLQNDSLKQIAFKMVLSKILNFDNMDSNKKYDNSKAKSISPKIESSAGIESTIELDPELLKELKEYYEDKAPKGNENSVFIIASFIDEKIKKASFTDDDIYNVYIALLPLKPKPKLPLLNQKQIGQILRNLLASSRKKMWLKRNKKGQYEISSQGRFQLSYEFENKSDKD